LRAANVGPSDAPFELWYKGEQLARDNVFKVSWMEGERIAPAQKGVPMLSTGRWLDR